MKKKGDHEMSKEKGNIREKMRSRKIKNLVSHIWKFSAHYIIGLGEGLRDWEPLTTRKTGVKKNNPSEICSKEGSTLIYLYET